MISLLFFSFVALVLIFGFVIAINIHRKRRKAQNGEGTPLVHRRQGKASSAPYPRSAFNETRPGHLKGGILPADSKLSQRDPNKNEEDKNGNRPAL